MTYRVELNDDIVDQVVRLSPDLSRKFERCLKEISADPWDRTGPDFEIEELHDAPPDEASTILFTSAWFPAAILYFARPFRVEDNFDDDGRPATEEGVVRIYKLAWFS